MNGGPLAALARRTDPADPGAQNNLGVVLLARGHHAAAAAAFSRALALDPRMSLARRNLDAAGGQQWRTRRVAELRARLRAHDADVEARYELARVLGDAGRLIDARRELEALATQLPNDAGPCVQRALLEQHAGDLDAAADWLTRAIEREPRTALAHAQLGEVLYHRGEPTRALAMLDVALALAPDHADAHFVRGFVLGELGRVDEAAAARERALTINPTLGRALANLAARATPAGGSSPERKPSLGASPPHVQPAERTADAHLALGLAFRQKGYLDEAVREYCRALARGDDEVTAVRALGELHVLRGLPHEALVYWTRLTEIVPHEPAAWHGRAVAAHLSGDTDAAETLYRRGIAVAPATGTAAARLHNDLGVLRAATGSPADAAASLGAAVAADPTALVPRLNRAQLLASLGDGERAIIEYRAALRSAPTSADAWAGLGAVLAAAGRHRDARVALARAIDVDPSRADVRYELGFLAAETGDHVAARRETERAMAEAPLVVRRALALAIDLGAGAPPAASLAVPATPASTIPGFRVAPEALEALLGDALAPAVVPPAVPAEPDGHPYTIAEECLRAGLHDRAAAAVSAALARGAPRDRGLTLLADVFVAQGYYGEALERYREARAADPGSVPARVGEIRMLRETGRRTAAREAADALVATNPTNAEALALAALVRIDDDAPDAGRDALLRAMERATTAEAWSDAAHAWRALGERATEIEAARRALALAPARWTLRLGIARAYVAIGRVAEAEEELKQLLGEHPACHEACLELATLRRTAGDVVGARRLLVDVVEADPLHLDALAALAASLLDEGRADDARVAVARALRFDAAHASALALDGELLSHAGDVDRARSRWQRVLDLEPVGDGATRARRCLARWGR